MIEQTYQAQAATYTNWNDVLYRFYKYADNHLKIRYGVTSWDSLPDLIMINAYVKVGMTNDEIKFGAIKAADALIQKIKTYW
jgi:hypothetical protein